MSRLPAGRYEQILASHGLRCTRQRLAVLQALESTREHPTAEQLYQMVLKICPGVSLATVYNTLEVFCKAGLVLKLPGLDGLARFDATTTRHVHLRDLTTHRVTDLPDELSQAVFQVFSPELLQQIESQMGFRVRQIHIELLGESQSSLS